MMLSTLILLPLIGAAVIGFYPASISGKTARQISLAIAGMIFLWTVLLTIKFDPNQGNVQFTESLIWIDVLGLNYRLGVDGLSLPLLLLNGILTVIAIYSTDESIQRPKFYYSLIFFTEQWSNWSFFSPRPIIVLPVLRIRTDSPILTNCHLGRNTKRLCSY